MANWSKNSLNMRLWRAQKGLCCYCEKKMRLPHGTPIHHPKRASREHLRRRADGGTSEPDNLALAHSRCNHKRGDRDWLTYKSYVMNEF